MERELHFDDLNKVFHLPLCGTIVTTDHSESDNYVPWGGSEPGEKSPRWGMTNSEHWKNIMSERMTGENNPFYGKKHTEETKKRLSESRKKTHNSPEFLKKHKERYSNKGYELLTPEGKHVIIESSVREFSLKNGLNTSSVFKVLKGKIKQHHGWRLP